MTTFRLEVPKVIEIVRAMATPRRTDEEKAQIEKWLKKMEKVEPASCQSILRAMHGKHHQVFA